MEDYMSGSQLRNAQIKDGTLTVSKLVADFLAGSNWNITGGNNNATITGLADGVNNNDAVNKQQLDAAVSSLTGAKRLKGPIAGNADLTSNSTGNPYADGANQYEEGDVFQISSDGNLTVSDGTIEVKNGDEIVILNQVGDSAITVADVFKIDNTESTDILRTGNIEDSLTSSSVADVLSANQGLVLKGLIDDLNQFETQELAVTANGQTFTLANAPLAGAKNIRVFLNGQRIDASGFSVSGSVVTVSSAGGTLIGDCIVVDYRF